MSFPKRGKAKILFFAMILLIGFALFGCSDDKSTSVTNPNPNTLNPTGKIQGTLVDAMTTEPIVGAVVDIGVGKATTSSDGQFVITNVPATTDGLNGTVTGSYSVTIDMKNVTSPVNMKDAATTPRYPNYSYNDVEVKYTSLDDAEDDNDTNHDTPVTNLVANLSLDVGKLAATINGIVAYETNLQPVGSGWTVKLISTGSFNTGTGALKNVVATTTTDADSKFSFSNIESLRLFTIEASNSAQTYFATTAPDDVQAPADNETLTLTIQQGNALFASLTDDVNPTIISVTPENLADITPAATDVVFTFSEPIRQSAYTTTSPSADGMYYDVDVNWDGMKTGNIAHSISWNTDFTQLTVNIPTLSPSSIYSVDLCNANLTDDALHGVTNLCDTGKGVISFSTTGAASASAPTVAIVNPTAIDNVFPANIVELDWTAVTGAKKYNVYQADNQVWGETTTAGAFRIVGQVDTSSYTTTAPLSFVEGTEIKLTYSFYVKSVNSDNIESAESNTETAEDVVGPILTGAPASYRTDFSNGNDTIILLFTELLDETTAETGTYTLSNITSAPSISSAVYDASTKSVTLTLSKDLAVADIGKATITTGTDGINDSTQGGDDVESIPFGQGLANQVAITAGLNTVLDSVPGGDDVVVGTTITTGPDGICQSAVLVDDVQVIPVGQGLANQVAINAGPNLALDSTLAPDDVLVPAPIIITVSGVKDVAGNAIRTTGDAITSSGNIQ